MNQASMRDLLKSLDESEDKIILLKLYDEEKYELFSKRISDLRQALINLEDDKNLMAANASPIIEGVTHLEMELGEFMKNGSVRENDELLFGENEPASGEEAAKQHAVGVFRELAQVMGNMQEIDIDRLKKLKEQWEAEKGNKNYSEAEIYAIEEALANAFIEFQIKTCANEGRLPKEAKEDYCSPEIYERVFKKRVIDYAATLPKGSLERLDVESYCINWNLENALNSIAIWKGLSGVEPNINVEKKGGKEEISERPTIKSQTTKTPEESSNSLPLNLNEQARGNAVLIIYKKQLPDGTFELKRKIKPLDEQGRFRLFFNKDRVVGLHFLEGTTKLSFTDKKGDTKSSYNHLSEFPNLETVSLPNSLRFIEQGYFLNCDRLRDVFVGDKTFFNPNRQLFPENTTIHQNDGKTQGLVVIQEPEEKSALFSQTLSTGEHRTLKVHLKDGSLLPKSFVRAGYPGLEEVRFTKGTSSIEDYYWTQEYESIMVNGGKYSNIIGLKKVILPEGLYHLGKDTFENCENLEEVYMPNGIKRIPSKAFSGCKKLKNFKLPDTLNIIEQRAFEGCESLTQVDFPDGLDSVEVEAFHACKNLERVTFPQESREIERAAFKSCFGLRDLRLPVKMGRIGGSAFEGCSSLQSLCLPQKIKTIEKDAFKNNVCLEEVLMPREYTTIQPLFDACERLHYAIVPTSMREEDAGEIFRTNYFVKCKKVFDEPNGRNSRSYLAEKVKELKAEIAEAEAKRAEEAKSKKAEETKENDKTDKEPKDDDIEK